MAVNAIGASIPRRRWLPRHAPRGILAAACGALYAVWLTHLGGGYLVRATGGWAPLLGVALALLTFLRPSLGLAALSILVDAVFAAGGQFGRLALLMMVEAAAFVLSGAGGSLWWAWIVLVPWVVGHGWAVLVVPLAAALFSTRAAVVAALATFVARTEGAAWAGLFAVVRSTPAVWLPAGRLWPAFAAWTRGPTAAQGLAAAWTDVAPRAFAHPAVAVAAALWALAAAVATALRPSAVRRWGDVGGAAVAALASLVLLMAGDRLFPVLLRLSAASFALAPTPLLAAAILAAAAAAAGVATLSLWDHRLEIGADAGTMRIARSADHVGTGWNVERVADGGGLLHRPMGSWGVATVVLRKMGREGTEHPFVLLSGEQLQETFVERMRRYEQWRIPLTQGAVPFDQEQFTLKDGITCQISGVAKFEVKVPAVPTSRGRRYIRWEEATAPEREQIARIALFQGDVSETVRRHVLGALQRQCSRIGAVERRLRPLRQMVSDLAGSFGDARDPGAVRAAAIGIMHLFAQQAPEMQQIAPDEIDVSRIRGSSPDLLPGVVTDVSVQNCPIPLFCELSENKVYADTIGVPVWQVLRDPARQSAVLEVYRSNQALKEAMLQTAPQLVMAAAGQLPVPAVLAELQNIVGLPARAPLPGPSASSPAAPLLEARIEIIVEGWPQDEILQVYEAGLPQARREVRVTQQLYELQAGRPPRAGGFKVVGGDLPDYGLLESGVPDVRRWLSADQWRDVVSMWLKGESFQMTQGGDERRG